MSDTPSRASAAVSANALVPITVVSTGLLSAETCILARNARLRLGTDVLFYYFNAFAALSGSDCRKSPVGRDV